MAVQKGVSPHSPEKLRQQELVREAQHRATEAQRADSPDAIRLGREALDLMRKYDMAEEPHDVDAGVEVPAGRQNPNEIILIALSQARAKGDEASAKKLEMMLDHPEQATALLQELSR